MAAKPYKFTSEKRSMYVKLLRKGLRRCAAARKVGLSRWTLRQYINADPEFATEVAEAEMEAHELVEDALFQKAVNGNVTAQIFYLTNRCPERWQDRRRATTEIRIEKPLNEITDEIDRMLDRLGLEERV